VCIHTNTYIHIHRCPLVGDVIAIRVTKGFWYDQQLFEKYQGVKRDLSSPTSTKSISFRRRYYGHDAAGNARDFSSPTSAKLTSYYGHDAAGYASYDLMPDDILSTDDNGRR
jgi:hypothetical protein